MYRLFTCRRVCGTEESSAGEGGVNRPAAGNMEVEIVTVLLLLVNKQRIYVTMSPIHCLIVAPLNKNNE